MPESLEELAYDEASAALDRQEAAVVALRTRSSAVLASATVVAGLLVRSNLDAGLVIGLALYLVLGVVTLWILWPHEFVFKGRIEWLLSEAAQARAAGQSQDVPGVLYARAYWMSAWYDTNRAKIDRLLDAFALSLVLLGLQVLALTAHAVA